LKSIIHGRKDLPIYLAAIGPKNVALTGEIGDGLLTSFFSPDQVDIWTEPLQQGFARGGEGKDFSTFDFSARVIVALDEDLGKARDSVKPYLGLYIGGMGARGKNFYNDLACRYGYEEAAEKIQELYLSGRQQEGIAAVPDELVDEVALCGSRGRIIERFSRYKQLPCQSLNMFASTPEALRLMAEMAL
jgi:alkanesulfonate monooxygenase SsuD/methylene tetrahydromethanopterin reductase-like flavin-dependent oxidoreductase (luciferase family)